MSECWQTRSHLVSFRILPLLASPGTRGVDPAHGFEFDATWRQQSQAWSLPEEGRGAWSEKQRVESPPAIGVSVNPTYSVPV